MGARNVGKIESNKEPQNRDEKTTQERKDDYVRLSCYVSLKKPTSALRRVQGGINRKGTLEPGDPEIGRSKQGVRRLLSNFIRRKTERGIDNS